MIKKFCDVCKEETDRLESLWSFSLAVEACPRCYKKAKKWEKKTEKERDKDFNNLKDKHFKSLKEYIGVKK